MTKYYNLYKDGVGNVKSSLALYDTKEQADKNVGRDTDAKNTNLIFLGTFSVEEKIKTTVWFNVYYNNEKYYTGSSYPTKEEALRNKGYFCYIKTISVEVEV